MNCTHEEPFDYFVDIRNEPGWTPERCIDGKFSCGSRPRPDRPEKLKVRRYLRLRAGAASDNVTCVNSRASS